MAVEVNMRFNCAIWCVGWATDEVDLYKEKCLDKCRPYTSDTVEKFFSSTSYAVRGETCTKPVGLAPAHPTWIILGKQLTPPASVGFLGSNKNPPRQRRGGESNYWPVEGSGGVISSGVRMSSATCPIGTRRLVRLPRLMCSTKSWISSWPARPPDEAMLATLGSLSGN